MGAESDGTCNICHRCSFSAALLVQRCSLHGLSQGHASAQQQGAHLKQIKNAKMSPCAVGMVAIMQAHFNISMSFLEPQNYTQLLVDRGITQAQVLRYLRTALASPSDSCCAAQCCFNQLLLCDCEPSVVEVCTSAYRPGRPGIHNPCTIPPTWSDACSLPSLPGWIVLQYKVQACMCSSKFLAEMLFASNSLCAGCCEVCWCGQGLLLPHVCAAGQILWYQTLLRGYLPNQHLLPSKHSSSMHRIHCVASCAGQVTHTEC